MWGHTPLISALARQRQENLCEFKASLIYRKISRKKIINFDLVISLVRTKTEILLKILTYKCLYILVCEIQFA